MGVMNCTKHGKIGIALTCPHLSDSIYKFQEILDVVRILENKKNPNNKFGYDEIHYLCKDCAEKYKHKKFSEYIDELLEPTCAKCLLELTNIEDWN